MDWRKVGIAIGAVFAAVLIGAAIYFVFFRRPEAPPPEPPPVTLVPVNAPPIIGPGVGLAPTPPTGFAPLTPTAPTAPVEPSAPPTPTIAQGGATAVVALTTAPVSFTNLSGEGRPQYYDRTTQRFYRVGDDGRPISLSDRSFPNVKSVTWSPRDDRAILEFPDGANVIYDFRTNQQTTLPSHWTAFSFSPDGRQIAGKSIGIDPENRWLFEAGSDGTGFRAVEPLGRNERFVDVAWSPNNQVVAFSRTGEALGDGRQQILAIGRNGENFPGLVVEGSDFRPRWSPSGSRILYSATHAMNEYKPELWVVDGSGTDIGANRQRLRIDTWADKCSFADDQTLFCAIPERLGRGYGLEPAVANGIPDTIERIDLTTGIRTTVGRPTDGATIQNMTIAPDGSRLFYTSTQDGRLFEMRLR